MIERAALRQKLPEVVDIQQCQAVLKDAEEDDADEHPADAASSARERNPTEKDRREHAHLEHETQRAREVRS